MPRYFKEFYEFLKHIMQNRNLLIILTKNDFKKQYLGSYFGLMWAYVQPISYMLVIWFVFTYGFRTSTNGKTPHFLWLMSGMIPWFFISNALTSGTNAIVNNAYLVKKVAFRVSILPLVQIGSAFLLHLGLVLFIIVMFLFYGFSPTVYWFQLFYFIFCAIFFLLGATWLTSSLRVFIKDTSNLITVLIQMGFWATPIFWKISMIPPKYRWIFELNPAYYIVEGYRNTFIYHKWFWQMDNATIFFYFVSISFFIIGAVVFKKLRPHFGDVL